MGTNTTQSFWTDGDEEHQEIARQFYEGIEMKHPNRVTSRGMCPCLEYTSWCGWAATQVVYYEYNGPRI